MSSSNEGRLQGTGATESSTPSAFPQLPTTGGGPSALPNRGWVHGVRAQNGRWESGRVPNPTRTATVSRLTNTTLGSGNRGGTSSNSRPTAATIGQGRVLAQRGGPTWASTVSGAQASTSGSRGGRRENAEPTIDVDEWAEPSSVVEVSQESVAPSPPRAIAVDEEVRTPPDRFPSAPFSSGGPLPRSDSDGEDANRKRTRASPTRRSSGTLSSSSGNRSSNSISLNGPAPLHNPPPPAATAFNANPRELRTPPHPAQPPPARPSPAEPLSEEEQLQLAIQRSLQEQREGSRPSASINVDAVAPSVVEVEGEDQDDLAEVLPEASDERFLEQQREELARYRNRQRVLAEAELDRRGQRADYESEEMRQRNLRAMEAAMFGDTESVVARPRLRDEPQPARAIRSGVNRGARRQPQPQRPPDFFNGGVPGWFPDEPFHGGMGRGAGHPGLVFHPMLGLVPLEFLGPEHLGMFPPDGWGDEEDDEAPGPAVGPNGQPVDMSYEALVQLEDVPTPLPAALLRKIPKSKFNHKELTEAELKEGPPKCPICLNEFVDGEEIATLPDCLHQFHFDCVSQWFKQKKHCCVCKTEVGSQVAL